MARVAVTPEQIGLVGCWQVLRIRRERILLGKDPQKTSVEDGYYVTSRPHQQTTSQELGEIVRGHWAAIENGVHYRRDQTFGEDACRVVHPVGGEMLAVLRNLAIGLYCLEVERKRTPADSLNNWLKRQTFTRAWRWLRT